MKEDRNQWTGEQIDLPETPPENREKTDWEKKWTEPQGPVGV